MGPTSAPPERLSVRETMTFRGATALAKAAISGVARLPLGRSADQMAPAPLSLSPTSTILPISSL